jgi:hypothetical protein
VPVAGGEERLCSITIVQDLASVGGNAARHLFATAETPDHALIEFFSFATSKSSLVMSLEKGLPDTTSALSLSPDGRLMIWTQLDQISSDITP